MRIPSLSFPLLAGAIACSALTLSSCGNGQDRSAATSEASAEVPEQAAKATAALDRVQASLTRLQGAEGAEALRKGHQELAGNADRLGAALAATAASSEAAVASGREQIAKWHQEADTFTEVSLREASSRREGQLREAVDALAACNANLATSGGAYRAKLGQTINALDLDLSQQGIAGVGPVIAKLNADQSALRGHLSDVTAGSRAVRAVISP